MRAGAHSNAGAVDDGRNVVRVGAFHLEGDDRALAGRRAEDAQGVDFTQPLLRVRAELGFVRTDACLADRIDIVDRRTKPDRLHDRWRTGLKLVRRLAVTDAILEHF